MTLTPLLSTQLSILTLTFCGIALLAAIVLMVTVLPRLRRVRRAVAEDSANADGLIAAVGEWPSVSVVVHSCSDARALSLLLPQILGQDYAGRFEVIVVNDGCDEAVSRVVAALEGDHRNLYMTFAQCGSRNLSRKKLAITLGAKAARYDTVVTVDGNCRLRSSRWLSLMMAPVAAGAVVVTGYGFMVSSDESARLGRLASFDTVRTAVQYLYSALGGRIYRAFGANMAFNRQLFFANKGFSGSLNLRGGHDDIFVSSLAANGPCGVMLADESMVEVVEDAPNHIHRLDKLRHNFTASYVSIRQRLVWGFATIMWWLWTLASCAAIVSGLPSLVPLIGVTVVSLVLCVPLMVTWRRTCTCLHSRRLALTVPFFFWISPVYNFVYRIIGRRHRDENFTWSSSINA